MRTYHKPLDLNWALNTVLPPLDFVLPGLEPEMFGLIVTLGGTARPSLVWIWSCLWRWA